MSKKISRADGKVSVDSDPIASASAQQTLNALNSEILAMRSVLSRLQQDVLLADATLNNHQTAQLLEANEYLTLSVLSGQAQLEASAAKLDEAMVTTGMDALTALPNRMRLLDRLDQAIQAAKRSATRLAVLFVDLDNFKQVNDDHGHAMGDHVLKLTARCLADSVRGGDTVSRHGGDEFLVLLVGLAEVSDAVAVAKKITATLAGLKLTSLAGKPAIHLSASIGISIYPDHGADSTTLIELADAAMYRVKRTEIGGNAVHSESIASDAKQAFKLASRAELRTQRNRFQDMVADMHLRQILLQEANERLVLSTLRAQELQSAAELNLTRQSERLNEVKK